MCLIDFGMKYQKVYLWNKTFRDFNFAGRVLRYIFSVGFGVKYNVNDFFHLRPDVLVELRACDDAKKNN